MSYKLYTNVLWHVVVDSVLLAVVEVVVNTLTEQPKISYWKNLAELRSYGHSNIPGKVGATRNAEDRTTPQAGGVRNLGVLPGILLFDASTSFHALPRAAMISAYNVHHSRREPCTVPDKLALTTYVADRILPRLPCVPPLC